MAYGYTASGYGYVEDMPYAYIHEFTRTSMAGKIRRFKGGYTSLWKKISKALPIVRCNTEVSAVKRYSDYVSIDVKKSDGEVQNMEFDKIIVSGSFPLNYGRTYRSPSHSTGLFVTPTLLFYFIIDLVIIINFLLLFLCEISN